jgi:N-acetylneuraminic acid mutarotase
MKKQINPTIKAHLIRGACYVLLLLAVCVIPFALAQRNTTKRSAARPKATAVDKAKLMAARAKTGAPASLTGATRIPQRKPASGLSRAMRATDVPQAPNLGSWNIVANYPFASESVSCSSDGTFGYCVGGFDPNIGPSNSFNQYDPVGDTWTPLSSIPTGFYDAPSVYAANTNSIYVFGGIDTSFVVRDIVQRYDVGTGTWLANGTPMPDPAGRYFAAAAYDSTTGKIYVMGGFDGATFSEQTNNWIYDPVADTWDSVTGAPIPVAMGGAGYSIVGDNIYLAGHWNGGLGSTDHYRYDVLANTWTPMAPVPVNIYRPDAAGIGTNTYLVGGDS